MTEILEKKQEFYFKNDPITFKTNVKLGNSITNSLRTNISGDYFHSNYLEYLSYCYAGHAGCVVKPDYIWYTFLCEVANIIKEDFKTYQTIFTNSSDKVEISIANLDPEVINVNNLLDDVLIHIPTIFSEKIINPKFSTTNLNDIKAFKVAFLDAVSPYYNYSMYMCGFNKLKVLGSVEDYKLLLFSLDYWDRLFARYPIVKYIHSVQSLIQDIIDNFTNSDFWENIFYLKKCGSGSQVEAAGWFCFLYHIQNFNTHISRIEYKNLTTNKKYELNCGLFSSLIKDDYLIPDFGFYVNEIK